VSVFKEVVVPLLMTTQPGQVTTTVPRDHTGGEPDQGRQKVFL